MLKEERQAMIIKLLNESGIIKVKDISNSINVAEMTIRRDLQELDSKGLLKRIHGGARLNDMFSGNELSHNEKQIINIDQKKYIAKRISTIIKEGDSIFLGTGTTIELVYDYLNVEYLRVVTNSIPVFNKFCSDDRYDLVLVGGSYRRRTCAFVGSIANEVLSKIKISKAFIGVNGIYDREIYNYSEDEGMIQATVMNNSLEKYIVADSTKLDKTDFYKFYSLDNITSLITDSEITNENLNKYSRYVKIIY